MRSQELLSILPVKFRSALTGDRLKNLQEIRLRLGQPGLLICVDGRFPMKCTPTEEDLRFCVNAASRYSPWNAATIREGYLTAPGGHRIGLCGEAAGETLRSITSLCIRISRDIAGLADRLPIRESTLILGPPGSGKTTLLRDMIRRISRLDRESIAVVDQRCEIFPLSGGHPCYDTGPNTDILSGRAKGEGIDCVLRSMGPGWIAVDEITAETDCAALVRAGWCGVKLLATAHASVSADLHSRSIYRSLVSEGLFRSLIVMHPDKSYHRERI
jgi:stage III sporulation protein AA